MAKYMRTQPTSQNSTPHIPKPWFRNISFCILSYFTYFGTPHRVSRVLPEKCLTGVGYIDADWKVSASKIAMNLDLWTESLKIEVQHFLTTKSSISGLWVFDWFWPPCHGNLSLDPPPLVTKVTRMGLDTASSCQPMPACCPPAACCSPVAVCWWPLWVWWSS